ncbi:MAG: hypothetical protein ACKVOS_02335 [Sphingorhabdus sp.]|uniref:hypothetical protein n=1 Tax=Sphingorhabdus sp. TaxID=1902408 RepID=UPI0038FBF013
MDNILKLLLGVLGVAGLITFVTSSLTFEEPPVAVAQAAPAPTPATPVAENAALPNPDEVTDEGSPEEDGEDILAIGVPVIDGNPYGSSNQQSLQNEVQIPQEQIPNAPQYYGQVPQQSYAAPQYNVPQSATGNFDPALNGQ